jgi:LacI family transcriptional regulator
MNRLPQRQSLPAQTAAILKEEIQAGRWCEWMPGEHELSRQLHVGRVTLRAALAQLQREGWVRSRQGKRRQIIARRGRAAPVASGRVVLLTPAPMQMLRPFTVLWTNELREHLAEAGYNLETHGSHAFYGQGWAANLEVLARQLRPVGFVLTATTQKMQRWFAGRGLPCVIAGSRHPGIELPCVDNAYRAICRHAAGQFLARGHARLVFLNPDSGAAGELESEAGFREALAQTGHADVQASVVRHDETIAQIRRKLDGLLRQEHPPTAFLVSRATNVLPVMGHLMSRGRRLPEDAALISRDYEPYLERVVPSVARYVVNPSIMANRVAHAVLQVVQGRMPTPADCHIMPEFTEGETLGSGVDHGPRVQTAGQKNISL